MTTSSKHRIGESQPHSAPISLEGNHKRKIPEQKSSGKHSQSNEYKLCADHIARKNVELLSWIPKVNKDGDTPYRGLYHPNPLFKTMYHVKGAANAHGYDTRKFILFSSLPDEKYKGPVLDELVMPINYGTHHALKEDELENVIVAFKKAGTKKITIYLGEYLNLQTKPEDLKHEEARQREGWKRQTQGILNKHLDVIHILEQETLVASEAYKQAEKDFATITTASTDATVAAQIMRDDAFDFLAKVNTHNKRKQKNKAGGAVTQSNMSTTGIMQAFNKEQTAMAKVSLQKDGQVLTIEFPFDSVRDEQTENRTVGFIQKLSSSVFAVPFMSTPPTEPRVELEIKADKSRANISGPST